MSGLEGFGAELGLLGIDIGQVLALALPSQGLSGEGFGTANDKCFQSLPASGPKGSPRKGDDGAGLDRAG